MRLSAHQRESIKRSVEQVLPGAEVLLYGSRTDDQKRGGDIDLLVLSRSDFDRSASIKILAALYRAIGEQKIDLLVEDPNRLSDFARIVRPSAIPL